MVNGRFKCNRSESQLENRGRNPKGQINPKSGKEYRVYNFGSIVTFFLLNFKKERKTYLQICSRNVV